MKSADMSRPAQPSGFLPQVESLRGLAALAVAYGHSSLAVLYTRLPMQGADWFFGNYVFLPLNWLFDGRAAVILFFVMSGLVLSLALDEVPALASVRAFASFVVCRSLRIFPAHVAALCVFVPLAYFTVFKIPVADPAALDATTFGFKLWLDGTVYGHLNKVAFVQTAVLYANYYNPVTWTLHVEMLGSLALPFFAALSKRGKWALDVAALGTLSAAALCVDPVKAPDSFILYLPAFYLGCMVRVYGPAMGAALANRPIIRFGTLILSLALLLVPSALTGAGTNYPLIAITALGAGGLLIVLAWGGTRMANRLLLHPALRKLGQISYSFYLWHLLVLIAYVRLLFIAFSPDYLADRYLLVQSCTLLVTIPLALAIARLSCAKIERPFVAFGRRLLAAPKQLPGRLTDRDLPV